MGKNNEMALAEEPLPHALNYSLNNCSSYIRGWYTAVCRLLCYFNVTDFARGYQEVVALLAVQVVIIFELFFTMYLYALDYQKIRLKSFQLVLQQV